MPKVKLRNNNLNGGQSLIEVLIALSIFVVGVATIGFLVLDADTSSRQGVERTQAILLAREGLEAVRSIRDADFDNLTAGSHGIVLSENKWIFSGASDRQNQFERVVTITDIDIDTKQVQSKVTWQFTQARQNSVTLTDYLTDWNQTQGQGGENFIVDISDATLGGGNKELRDVLIENTGGSTITISKMTVWWANSNTLNRIRIEDTNVFNVPARKGVSPGTEIDITNFSLASGGDGQEVRLRFNGSMLGTDFIIKFIMTDGSTKYTLVDL